MLYHKAHENAINEVFDIKLELWNAFSNILFDCIWWTKIKIHNTFLDSYKLSFAQWRGNESLDQNSEEALVEICKN